MITTIALISFFLIVSLAFSDSPVVNIGSGSAMKEHADASHAASAAAADAADSPSAVVASSSVPPTDKSPTVPVAPGTPSAVAEPISPVAESAVAADVDVQMDDGRMVPLKEVQAGYSAARELGLDDQDNRDFLTTIYRAQRGDAAAMGRIEALVNANAPALAEPSSAVPPPAGDATAAMKTTSAVAVPTAIAPVATPNSLSPAATTVPVIDTGAIVSAIENLVKPMNDRLSKMEPFVQGKVQTDQLAALTDTIEKKKEQWPNLARSVATSVPRLLEGWNAKVEHATRNKIAQPDARDLERLISTEESYLAAAMPVLPPPPSVVRNDGQPTRIPGKPFPGRADIAALNTAQVPQPPAAPVPPVQAVSTNMPLTGHPTVPLPVAPAAAPMSTIRDLKAKIDSDVALLAKSGALSK